MIVGRRKGGHIFICHYFPNELQKQWGQVLLFDILKITLAKACDYELNLPTVLCKNPADLDRYVESLPKEPFVRGGRKAAGL
jgi:hypothetical protein